MKLHKILGVALTVTVLVSLMVGVSAAPVAAGELEWDTKGLPPAGSTGDYFWDDSIDDTTDVNRTLSPGPVVQAIDGTFYAYVLLGTTDTVLKSDDGRKWSKTKYAGGPVVDFAASSADADILYVADANDAVWWTKNAGSKWEQLASPGEGNITSIEVGYISDTAYVFVSTLKDNGGVFWFKQGDLGSSWTDSALAANLDTWLLAQSPPYTTITEDDIDVLDVAISNDFESDQMMVAIVLDTVNGETWAITKYASAQWGTTLAPENLIPDDATECDASNGARIWLPDDFDSDAGGSEMEYFVGLMSGDADEGDVYRLVTNYAYDLDIDGSNSATNVTSLDGVGGVSSPMIMAGTDGGNTFFSDGGGSWDKNKEAPTGDSDAYVLLADDFADTGIAYAAVCDGGDDEAAFSMTENEGEHWNQISLIDTDKSALNDFAFGSTFLATTSSGTTTAKDSLWRDDGDNWERVTVADHIDLLGVSPDGDAIFFCDSSNGNLSRSTDDGTSFRGQLSSSGKATFSFVAIDKNTVVVGCADGTYKTGNNGTTWGGLKAVESGKNVVSLALSPDFDSDETILAGTSGGKVFRSTDAAGGWKEITKGGFGGTSTTNAYVAFHPDYADNSMFFACATDSGLVVERYSDDDEWRSIWSDSKISTTFTTTAGNGIALGSDGTLYVSDTVEGGVLRCLNPDVPNHNFADWEQADKDAEDKPLAGIQVTEGSNMIWGINGADFYVFEDTLTGSVTLAGPSDGSSTGRVDSATLSWDAMDGADEYEVDVNTDPGFKGSSYDPADTKNTTITITGLEDGQTYYWRVRVAKGEPLWSRRSDVWSFTTELGAGQWNPFVGGVPEAPANGATNVPLQPTFAWNAADWATGYEFVLAKDAAFADALVQKTGANALTTTVYLSEQKLANSTTYYWKVRAISKTSDSEWASAVFTTEGPAPAAPTPPSAPPPPEPLGTPAYIWVIIGIGAALVIAVIILIVRTRRVA